MLQIFSLERKCNSVYRMIWSEFELVPNIMPALVIWKHNDNPIKNPDKKARLGKGQNRPCKQNVCNSINHFFSEC